MYGITWTNLLMLLSTIQNHDIEEKSKEDQVDEVDDLSGLGEILGL